MQTVVGILRGGPSHEHEVSLATGASMLASLPETHYVVRDIYIDKQGQWHDRGRITTPDRALRQLDAALIGLHGAYGENGEIQRLLNRFGIPYASSDSFGSYLAMHKVMAKIHAQEAGLRTPAFLHVERPEKSAEVARDAIRMFSQPVVVKPVGWSSSLGISIVGGYAPVLAAIEELFAAGAADVFIEEYIKGREATIGVVEGLRGQDLYTLPALEVVPPEGEFFSHAIRYSGAAREICPANFSRVEAEELQRLAKIMHRSLGLRHYSSSDFLVTPKGIYYLETDTLPDFTKHSPMPLALASVGLSLQEFFSHLASRARVS